MKGKMKLSNFEGLTPMKEECSSKTTAKIKFLNTYRLEPYNKFQDQLVRGRAQAILTVASRWVWDVQRDTWVSAKCETETFIALALIMACYYE